MEHSRAQIIIDNVFKSFRSNGTVKRVLNGISLEVRGGEFTTVVGPNASGKTTLLNLIAGQIPPDKGTLELRTDHGRPAEIGYVWQNYRASLLPWLDVFENIAFPLRLRGRDRTEREEAVTPLLDRFMPDVDPRKPCYELSGGQQQLLCLLRSTTIQPDVLLLDEPFSALDQQRSWNMALYVEQLWMEQRPPALFVSHDVDEAILLADKIILMNANGEIADILRNPLPRPRSLETLTSPEHLKCRADVVGFLQGKKPGGTHIDQ